MRLIFHFFFIINVICLTCGVITDIDILFDNTCFNLRQLKKVEARLAGQVTVGGDKRFYINRPCTYTLARHHVIPYERIIKFFHHARSARGAFDGRFNEHMIS